MEKTIQRIVELAKAQGACRLTEDINDVESICKIFFKPQGREFCIEHEFPTIADFRLLKALHVSEYGVFVDSGDVKCHGGTNYAAIGKTRLDIGFSGADNTHHIIAMHGGKVTVYLAEYAVVRIEKTEDSEVEVINEDNTGIALW